MNNFSENNTNNQIEFQKVQKSEISMNEYILKLKWIQKMVFPELIFCKREQNVEIQNSRKQ